MAEHQEQIPKQDSLDQDSEISSYLQHLPYHLYSTKQYDSLHELIDYPWMEMRRRQFSGSYEGFLNDIELAINSPIPDSNKWMSLQVRYSLMKSSIRSLASKFPPELYPLLVKYDFWGISEAVTNATNIIEPELRCKALIYLANITQVSPKDKEILYREILNMPLKPVDRHLEWWIFKALSSLLPKNLLNDAIQIARQKPFENRYISLSALLPFLENGQREILLDEIASEAHKLVDGKERLSVLEKIAPYLTKEQLLYALNLSFTVGLSKFEKRNSLLSMVGFLPLDLHDNVLNILNDFDDELHKIEILVCLAERKYLELGQLFGGFRLQPIPEHFNLPLIPKPTRSRELKMALDIFSNIEQRDVEKKVDCLNVIGTSSLELTKYHEFVLQNIGKNESKDGYIFEIFYPRFSVDERKKAMERLWSMTNNDHYLFLFSCSSIAARLSSQDAAELLTKIFELTKSGIFKMNDDYLYKVMGALIFQLEASSQVDWLNRTIPLFSEIGDKKSVQYAANKFAQHSGKTEVFTTRELLDMFGKEMVRMEYEAISSQIKQHYNSRSIDWTFLVQSLVNLVPFLSTDQLSDAIDLSADAEGIAGDFTHNYDALILSGCIEHVPIELYDKLIARLGKRGCYYRCVMFDLVPSLPNNLLAKLLLVISSIEDDKKRELSYYNLSPHFSDELLTWLIEKKSHGQLDENNLAEMLKTYRRPRLDFDQAFMMCSHLPDDDFDILLLSWMPHLYGAYREKSIEASFRMVFKPLHFGPHPEVFPCIRLAPFLPLNLYLTMFNSIQSQPQLRVILLQILFERLETSDKNDVTRTWSKLLNILSESQRASFLNELSESAKFLSKFNDIQILQDILFHIRETSRWWN